MNKDLLFYINRVIFSSYAKDVMIEYGDFPYFACYSKDAWDKGLWNGSWFATEKYDFVIYVPKSAQDDEKLWGLLHEFGHYMNRHNDFCTAKDECRAWEWAEREMSDMGYDIPDE